jgi:hypothetical protein
VFVAFAEFVKELGDFPRRRFCHKHPRLGSHYIRLRWAENAAWMAPFFEIPRVRDE